MKKSYQVLLPFLLVCLVPLAARAQSFRVQCPTSTVTHPNAANNNRTERLRYGPPQTLPRLDADPLSWRCNHANPDGAH